MRCKHTQPATGHRVWSWGVGGTPGAEAWLGLQHLEEPHRHGRDKALVTVCGEEAQEAESWAVTRGLERKKNQGKRQRFGKTPEQAELTHSTGGHTASHCPAALCRGLCARGSPPPSSA